MEQRDPNVTESSTEVDVKNVPDTADKQAAQQDIMRAFRCAVAVYLVYLGGSLACSVWRGETSGTVLYILAAVLFMGGGVFFLVRDLPALCKKIFSPRL